VDQLTRTLFIPSWGSTTRRIGSTTNCDEPKKEKERKKERKKEGKMKIEIKKIGEGRGKESLGTLRGRSGSPSEICCGGKGGNPPGGDETIQCRKKFATRLIQQVKGRPAFADDDG